jgi:hypothetical protein
MNVFEIVPLTYLNAAALGGQVLHDSIRAVKDVEFEGGRKKIVINLDKDGRAVVLNRTNLATLVEAYGPETDGWLGKPVIVGTEMTVFQGRKIAGVKVRIPSASSQLRSAINNPFASENSSDDEYHFKFN